MGRGSSIVRSVCSSTAASAAIGWIAIYGLVVATGQRFDTRYLNYGWQLLPWDVLSADPVTSVWYLHIQPPLWNLLLGATARISPFGDGITLQILMAAFGIAAASCAATLALRLGATRRAAIAIALVATVHPESLKGAFEPTYELPVAALLLAVLAVIAGLDVNEHASRVRRRVILVAVLVTAVSMTRSLYHPVWALMALAIVLWCVRGRVPRRTLAVSIAVPILVMGAWTMKNQILFGQANLSSWFGMNLQRAVIPVLDQDDLEEMHARGEVSDIALIGPFGKYELYEDVVAPCTPKRTHPVLSEPMRTTDQWSPNFNYECYLPIFEQAGRDARAVIRSHPGVWLEGRLWSLRSTASVAVTPGESPSIIMRSLDRAYSWARVDYSGVLSTRGWGTPIYGQLTAPVDFGLMLIPLYLVAAGMGVCPVVARCRRTMTKGRLAVSSVASVTIVFTVIVGAVAELGEQARFRTMTDPLVVVVAATSVASFIRYRRSRSEDRRSSLSSSSE